jgi:hypothetical protein
MIIKAILFSGTGYYSLLQKTNKNPLFPFCICPPY